MFEESFKAMEGSVAYRKTKVRSRWPDGYVYLFVIMAGEINKRAAKHLT